MTQAKKVAAPIVATEHLHERPVWVKKRRKTMSAVTAAFAESGHGGPIPRDRDEHCASKVRQAAPRRDGGRLACVFGNDPCSMARRFRLTSGAATGHGEGLSASAASFLLRLT